MKKPLLYLLFLVLSQSLVLGQGTFKISGKVSDSQGDPLIGASVIIKQTNQGAATNLNGIFQIENVSAGTYTITARYVGFTERSVTVVVGNTPIAVVNFVLQQSAIQMNETVITGQGVATERRKLTSPVESIKADEIKLSPSESVDQLLQGRIPGLNSFSSSGMPGTAGRIAARGLKSALTNATPVVYVDNVRVDNGDAFRLALNTGGAESSALADLVIGEIDRIEVIKGGASSTLFGSEAANGVIQIFTKKGTPGATRWSFDLTSGFDQPRMDYVTEPFVKDTVLRSGAYQSYGMNVSGGNQSFTYSLGGKMYLNDGIITSNLAQSKNYNLNSGLRVTLADNANLEVSTSYTRMQFNRTDNNNSNISPYGGFEDGGRSDLWGFTTNTRDSILTLMKSLYNKTFINRFRTAVNIDYTPIKDFKNRFTIGVDYRNSEERQFIPKKAGEFYGTEGGGLLRADREYLTVTMEYAGSYILPQLLGFVNQTIAFGAQGFRVEDREESASGTNYSIPGTDDLDNASQITAAESNRQLFSGGFYLSDQIGLFDRVFVDLGLRVDGNSTFGKDIGLQYYPKAGLAYNISQETYYPDFLKEVMSTLKLRASWGQTGNFPPPFTRDRTYTANAYLNLSGLAFGNPGNNNLGPEKTTSIDAGFDMGLLNDRISLEFSYYNQNTKDGLFLVPNDPASGFGLQYKNVGEISNKGIEISLFAKIFQSDDLSASVRFSYNTLENKVVSLGGSAPFMLSSFTFLPRMVQEGYPLGVFRVNVPIQESDGTYAGRYTTSYAGSPMPKQFGSFSFEISLFKNLTFNGLAEYAFGHQIVNLKKTLRYFNGTTDAGTIVEDTYSSDYSFETASTIWLEQADWIKIRELGLSYMFPKGFIKGLTLRASIRNVADFGVKTTKLDPELNGFQAGQANTGGYGYLDISAPRQFRLGITYNF